MLRDVSSFVVGEEAVFLRIKGNEITWEVEVRFFSVDLHLLLRERYFQAICCSFVVGAKDHRVAAFHVEAQFIVVLANLCRFLAHDGLSMFIEREESWRSILPFRSTS